MNDINDQRGTCSKCEKEKGRVITRLNLPGNPALCDRCHTEETEKRNKQCQTTTS